MFFGGLEPPLGEVRQGEGFIQRNVLNGGREKAMYEDSLIYER